jgi:hypothetical protein
MRLASRVSKERFQGLENAFDRRIIGPRKL